MYKVQMLVIVHFGTVYTFFINMQSYYKAMAGWTNRVWKMQEDSELMHATAEACKGKGVSLD